MIPNGFNQRSLGGAGRPLRPAPLTVQPVPGNFIIANQRNLSNRNVKQLVADAKRRSFFFDDLKNFLLEPGNFYLTYGGIGDLILLLAEAYRDPAAKIIFFANNTGRNFIGQILFTFGISNVVFDNPMGTPDAKKAYDLVASTGRLMPSQHLNDKLDYDDWKKRPEFYNKKIIKETDWKKKFGELENKEAPIVTIAPTGSFKNNSPQKYLHKHELESIINIYSLAGYHVYIVGSFADQDYYRLNPKKDVYWLSVDNCTDSRGRRRHIKCEDFFRIINSSDAVCSVDTWLKTYTCLVGIPTNVIMNRYNHISKYGEMAGDYIFINPNLWKTMNLVDVNEFIQNKCNF